MVADALEIYVHCCLWKKETFASLFCEEVRIFRLEDELVRDAGKIITKIEHRDCTYFWFLSIFIGDVFQKKIMWFDNNSNMVNVLLFLQSMFFFFVALFGYLILVIEIPFSVPSYYLFIAEICMAVGYLFSSSLYKFFFLFKLSNLVQIYSLHPAISFWCPS